jgi:DNA-binding LacI/PurR family transcriptional regulator
MKAQYTMVDVARAAGVSLSTVSRVLNNNSKVSDMKKEKVLKAVKKMGYNINNVASSLANNKSKEIGIMIPDITNPFFAELFKGIEDTISLRGYSISLSNTNYDKKKESDYINSVINNRAQGLIIVSTELNNKILNYIKDKINIVGILTYAEGIDRVDTDNREAAFKAVEYLIQNGHKKIAFFGWQFGVNGLNDRLQGYKDALKKYGIEFKQDYLIDCGFSRQDVYNAAQEFTKAGEAPTAIMAINDNTAIGIMLAFQKMGIKIPDDISLVGFDDIVTSRLVYPKLTTVAQPSYAIGETAGDMILNKIERVKKDNDVEKVVILKSKLVIRDSVKTLKQNDIVL